MTKMTREEAGKMMILAGVTTIDSVGADYARSLISGSVVNTKVNEKLDQLYKTWVRDGQFPNDGYVKLKKIIDTEREKYVKDRASGMRGLLEVYDKNGNAVNKDIFISVDIDGRASLPSNQHALLNNSPEITVIRIPSEIGLSKFEPTTLSNCMFHNNKFIERVILPPSVTVIEYDCFRNSHSLNSINLDNVSIIGPNAFSGCLSLERVWIEKLELMGSGAFEKCVGLTNVRVNDITHRFPFERGIFEGCISLTSVAIFNDDQPCKIPRKMFADCIKLRDVYLPSMVVKISEYAFDSCVSLTTLDISNLHESYIIADYSFMNCYNLRTLRLCKPETLGNTDIRYISDNAGWSDDITMNYNTPVG